MPGTVLNVLHILTCLHHSQQSYGAVTILMTERDVKVHRGEGTGPASHSRNNRQKQQKEGSTPDCRALESMLIVLHHLSPVLMRWCLDEIKLRMVVIKRKVNTKHSVPPGPQIASCFGAGPINHAKFILLSYV